MEMTFRTATKAEQMYCYTQSMQIMAQTGCIGHLRADMGSDGLGFYPTWEDHYVRLKDQAFKNEINQVIHALRVEEEYGCMLQNRVFLNRYCWSHMDAQMGEFSSDFAFRADTEKFSYLLRFNTNRGEYNLYCYCYVKGWLDDHLQKAEQGIRFIDPHYHNLFRLQDGGKIRIHHRDGTHKKLSLNQKNLTSVYQLLTQNSEGQLIAKFNKLPLCHPARAPFNLFAQSSDTVKSGIILGLGTRLQVLQNKAVQRITSQSDIDLVAPAKRKCVYYIILSDQDATMSFLSSLFFSCMFIKLSRFADVQPGGRCPVPVNLILDEFNNVGRIGGAEDGSDFARSLSVVRSRDIRVMLAVQSLGQLQNRYPKNLWSEIIGNCDIQLMMGCSDDVSAEFFSVRSGDMSVQVKSTMTVRQSLALAQVIPQYRSMEGHGRRRLLTPDEVLRLPNEEMLCIIRGHNILKLDKLDFTKHPMARHSPSDCVSSMGILV